MKTSSTDSSQEGTMSCQNPYKAKTLKTKKYKRSSQLYNRTTVEQKKILIKEIYEEGRTIAEAAIIAGLNKNTARNLIKAYKDHGEEIIQKKWGGGNHTKLTTQILDKIEQMLQEHPNLTLRMMQQYLAKDNIHISKSTIHNGLKDLKLTLKFSDIHPHNMSALELSAERKSYALDFLQNSPSYKECCIFIDECGFNLHQGKAVRQGSGESAPGNMVISPLVKGRNVTLIAAMTSQGIMHHKVLSNGVCSSTKFCNFLKELINLIGGTRDSNKIWIIVDKAQIHKTTEVEQIINDTKWHLKYLPLNSSILNPLEGIFTKVKILARTILNNPNLNESLLEVIEHSVESITSEDCSGSVRKMINELNTIGEKSEED